MTWKSKAVAWFALGCAVMLTPAMASAQSDAAYSPLRPNVSTMLTNGEFKESPLALPFAQTGVRAVSVKAGNVNFEHSLSVPVDEVIAYFDDKSNRKDGFAILDGRVYPAGSGVKLRVKGTQNAKDGTRKMRLAAKSISRDFVITIRPSSSGGTILTFENIVYTAIGSGVMPARVGFLPMHSDLVIPFNFN